MNHLTTHAHAHSASSLTSLGRIARIWLPYLARYKSSSAGDGRFNARVNVVRLRLLNDPLYVHYKINQYPSVFFHIAAIWRCAFSAVSCVICDCIRVRRCTTSKIRYCHAKQTKVLGQWLFPTLSFYLLLLHSPHLLFFVFSLTNCCSYISLYTYNVCPTIRDLQGLKYTA